MDCDKSIKYSVAPHQPMIVFSIRKGMYRAIRSNEEGHFVTNLTMKWKRMKRHGCTWMFIIIGSVQMVSLKLTFRL